MIFIMSIKQWNKDKKKLVVPKDYVVMDGTDDADAKLSAFTNVVTADVFCPPAKLLKLVSQDDADDYIDFDKLEELEDNYFDSLSLKNMMLAITANIIGSNDVNVFIVLRNKAFKYYKKRYKKAFNKMFDPNKLGFQVAIIHPGNVKDIKKELSMTLSSSQKEVLTKMVAAEEEKMRKLTEKAKKKKKRR